MTSARLHLRFHMTTVAIAALAIAVGTIPKEAFGKPGGGGRGAATSVHRGGGGGGAHAGAAARSNVNAGGNRGGNRAGDRNAVNRGGDRTNVNNRGGNRINNGNVNIGNDVNIDVDRGWDNDGWDNHPVARGVAFGTAAAVTSAVVGSMIYSLPPSCRSVYYSNVSYSQCGDVWYQPQSAGSSVTYVVVNPPY